jgi:hypothetical protein
MEYSVFSVDWSEIKKSISHAFMITDGKENISEEDMALLNKLASFIVRRRLTVPAIMFLETVRPMNFVGSSLMNFFKPTMGHLLKRFEYDRLEKMLENRCTIELLVECIQQQSKSSESGSDEKDNNGKGKTCQKTKSMSS